MIKLSRSWMAICMGFLLSMLNAGQVIGAQGETKRISVDSAGAQGNDFSRYPSISSDGRYVAFESWASNLVPDDTNGYSDVFIHDRQTGVTTRVSVDSAGVEANNGSGSAFISSDGRYVVFLSYASNLVPNDTNGCTDIFVHDRETGQTTRVSVDSAGVEGNGRSYNPSISPDGRYVAFESLATNLASNSNGWSQVFIHDRQTGQTTRVSVDSAGAQGNESSEYPSISSDGRYVAFMSFASNLVPNDTNDSYDIFVHDRETGQTTRESVDSSGVQANASSFGYWYPAISPDGRYVAFTSGASNLVPNDTNGYSDVFVHDRQTGVTTRVSVDSAGVEGNGNSTALAISPDGRYVAFMSFASNLVPDDTNGYWDVFVHDRQTGVTTRVSVDSAGNQGNYNSTSSSMSSDGRYVAFMSWANNLVPNDTNGTFDIFVYENCCSLSAAWASAGSGGGTGSVNVSSLTGICDWTAVSNASWITITSGSSGTGNGTVTYSIAANEGPSRTGTLRIAGRTFTVTQSSGCTYSLSPSQAFFSAAGGAGTVEVTTSSLACDFGVDSRPPWVPAYSWFTSSPSGWTVYYSVFSNIGPQRTGIMIFRGIAFTITQANGCTFSLSATAASFGSVGGTGSVNITSSSADCPWTAASNNPWVTITAGNSGAGNGTVIYSLAVNFGVQRGGTLSIAGQTYEISQQADSSPPSIQIVQPTNGPAYWTTNPTTDVAGTASDNGGVQQVTWVNNQGGSGVALGTTSWSVSGIALHYGPNSINFTAGDAAGENGSAPLTVFYNPREIGVYRTGAWYFDWNGNGGWDGCEVDRCLPSFGGVGIDLPIMGKWTGDGQMKLGIYRRGMWFTDNNGNGAWDGCEVDGCLGPFGGYEIDLPLAGDWTGDGRSKFGIYRQGLWYFDLNGNGTWDGCEVDGCLGPFGGYAVDLPVVGDWTGDGRSKIGIYRQGWWYLDLNGNGAWDGCVVDGCLGPFGGYAVDLPVIGDWTGDGRSKIGIYRQGWWYFDLNGNGGWDGCQTDGCSGQFGGFPVDFPIIR